MAADSNQFIIPKEKAAFWLDGNGRWHNAHGPFENSKIISFFNRHIKWDDAGYYVAQERENLLEKVYFRYEDTALFVFDILKGLPMELLLNTGTRLRLMPRKLIIQNDSLYMLKGNQRIKFVDRALVKLSKFIEFDDQAYHIRVGRRRYLIAEADGGDGIGRVER